MATAEIRLLDDDPTFGERAGAVLRAVGIDPPRLIFAVNIALAAVLALYFAFLVDLQNTFWALLTIPLVMKQQSGLTVWRSLSRFTGTMLGAAIGLLFVSVFAQDGLTMIAALSLWLLATGVLARFEVGIDAYAYGVAGLTTLIITMDTGPAADMAYTYAVSRTSETVIAIIAGFTVVLVVFPQSIVPVLKGNIKMAREKVLCVARLAVKRDDEPSPALRKEVAEALRQTFTNLRAWRFETSPSHGALPRLRTETSLLNDVIASAEALTFVLDPYRHGVAMPETVAAARENLERLVEAMPDAEESVETACHHAARFRDLARDLRGNAHLTTLAEEPSAARIEEVSALFRIYDLADRLAAFLEAEAAVLDPERSFETIPPGRTRYVDLIAALQLGARPAIAFLAVALFWIFSGWSEGRILALITGALSLLIPTIAPRAMLAVAGRKIGFGFLSMVPVALLLMAVLPAMQSFFGFAVAMGSVIFVLFYVCGEQQNIPMAIGGTVMLAIGLQPTNSQVYDPLALINAGATLTLMPVAFVTSVMVLFPNTPPRVRRHLKRGTDDLLAKAARRRIDRIDFLGQNIDLLADYGGDLDMENAVDRHHVERTRGATQVGLELFAVRRTGGVDLMPGIDDELARAAISASKRRRGEDPSDEVDALSKISAAARARLTGGTRDERFAAHRIVMAAAVIGALVAQRRIAMPEAGE